ncbi:MAG TPA: vWA domain-containing protein [Candidatus Lokiarchaeia archaeon]|nr:vWA domain-containing protein [Candidatus Lokiarchaeia archaeon]
MAVPIRDEDLIFYIDIIGKKFDKRSLLKALTDFIKQKSSTNPTGSYAVFMWEAGKTPEFTTNFISGEEVAAHIEKQWKIRDTEESYFENGLFYCLSHIANEYIRTDEKNLRVIVLSDAPSNPADTEKQQALIDLVEKFKWFPTFIDIIRIGNEKFYPDDVKLRIISATANGGLFYVEDEKGLRDTLVAGLAKRKSLEVLTPLGGDRYIDDEHHAFFANMASDLITPPPSEVKPCFICHNDICPVCGDPQDVPYMCPSCASTYHDCCAARYAVNNNIGIKYIFRCPSCESLLKVSQDAVATAEREVSPIAQPPEAADYDKDLLQEIMETENPSELVPLEQAIQDAEACIPREEDKQPRSELPIAEEEGSDACDTTNGPRFVPVSGTGFFKPRGLPAKKAPIVPEEESASESEVWTPPAGNQINDVYSSGLDEEALQAKSKLKKMVAKKVPPKGTPRVLLCKICGQTLPEKAARCPNCGSIVPR